MHVQVLTRQNAREFGDPFQERAALGPKFVFVYPAPSRSTCHAGHRRCTASLASLVLARHRGGMRKRSAPRLNRPG
eukprot:5059386-Alexandrium_andersonii.AAC.1